MTEEFRKELKDAGYTDQQIEKEAAYLERVQRENEYFRKYPAREWVADHGQE